MALNIPVNLMSATAPQFQTHTGTQMPDPTNVVQPSSQSASASDAAAGGTFGGHHDQKLTTVQADDAVPRSSEKAAPEDNRAANDQPRGRLQPNHRRLANMHNQNSTAMRPQIHCPPRPYCRSRRHILLFATKDNLFCRRSRRVVRVRGPVGVGLFNRFPCARIGLTCIHRNHGDAVFYRADLNA